MTAYAISRAGGTPQTHMVIVFADYSSHLTSAAGTGANTTPITLLAENFCVLSYDELPKYYFNAIDKELPLSGVQVSEMIASMKQGQSLPKGMVDYYLLIYFVPICHSRLSPFAMGSDELCVEDQAKLGFGPLSSRDGQKTPTMNVQELKNFGVADKEWLDKINASSMRLFSA